jgi:hypothetical protein
MRTLRLTCLLILLCAVTSSAQWTPTANLTIFSEDGARFYLVLNGERYNDVPQTNIRIEELPNPYYNCKIIFEDKSLPDISKNALMLTDADGVMQDVTYRIKKDNKGKNVLRFFSFVPAQQNMPRPSNCAIYRFGNPNHIIAGPGFIETNTISQTGSLGTGNLNINAGGVNMSIDMPVVSGSVTTTTTTTTTTTRGGNTGGYRDDYEDHHDDYQGGRNGRMPRQGNNNGNYRGGCRMAMNNADFTEAKNAISKNGFDETKLSTAKQIISGNCMSAAQINSILTLFGFEASKLDFAKYAYAYCVDPNNYFKVSNAFSFESSKTELNDYVQSMR